MKTGQIIRLQRNVYMQGLYAKKGDAAKILFAHGAYLKVKFIDGNLMGKTITLEWTSRAIDAFTVKDKTEQDNK